jgi:Fur family ferric uptake transcriptional regulator
MISGDELQGLLRRQGLRMTPQRQLILDAVTSSSGHISAETVHQQVVARFPNVNISTVYRTLDLLQDLGIVTHTHFDDGIAQYHRSEEGAHQHLACRSCGSQVEVDLALLEPLAHRLHEMYGFHADLAHFAIVGLCSSCSQAENIPTAPAAAPV